MVIKLANFYTSIVHNFLIAFGVVIGASVFAGIGAIITDYPPLKLMLNISSSIKIWAMAIAIGGTFSSFEVIEKGLFEGELKSIIKQIIYILVALLGANTGYSFIKLIQRCGEIWGN
ncbi:YtrH family sporulation protein [Alkaliphilus sp. B6464]|uniref:YtrH family sporulation protein n=1 Tax=Alkaliphilus sp. B6464 TaxID=2731219 RepID=UPI0020131AC6|nr:YtrH family sporulation protein [Alkaliphilus sp. B6464]